jgi:hypothetical protein
LELFSLERKRHSVAEWRFRFRNHSQDRQEGSAGRSIVVLQEQQVLRFAQDFKKLW